MGCSCSRTVATADVTNELDGRAPAPTPSFSGPSAGSLALPSIPVVHTDLSHVETSHGALSARSIGFNETYTPIKLLGKGSFGKVKLCESAGGGLVAVKICRCTFLDAQAAHAQRGGRRGSLRRNDKLEALKKEISIMKRLDHPNIVKLHYILEDSIKGKMFMVMDFVEGGSVTQSMTGEDGALKPLSEETTRKYMTDLLVALSYMHANGVVHRDVKPENMLISGDMKLSDFGVSEFIYKNSSGDELDLSSVTSGTPAFLAPECCQIGEFHTKQADIWAAGVSMYYMLFAAVPFVDNAEILSIAGQMRSIIEQPLVFPQGNSVSSPALQLLTQLLEKDPERRISLDSALLSPWITSDQKNLLRQPSLRRLPSGLPDNDILPDASAEDLRQAVINVSNWVLVVKVKQIASRHVQSFRERRKSQDEFVGGSLMPSAGEHSVAASSTELP